ncbi:carbohydrate-binding protein [Kitasatospora purpeofusca]|uniref:hypothetical protein n=1 Tax=Kitasatospora purpeofusca TaxID=67352 RepID=UPI0036BE449E|nr:hypothetical protein KPHV_14960 [Kitasatospora purpeofusca]
MSTSTGGNGARGGAAGIQLPSMDWEMEEEPAGAPAGAAASAGGAAAAAAVAAPATAEAPTEQVAVPQYGPVTPVVTAAAVPPVAVVPSAAAGFGPGEEPGAPVPVGAEGADGEEPEETSRRPRFRRPALVAAATAGVVLMGLPFLITDGADKQGDNRGVNRADPQLVDGPEIDDVQPPAPTDPPTTGLPLPAPVDPPATGDPGALTAPPADGSGTVPGLALGGGTVGTPAVPAGQPAGTNVPAGKAPQSGTQSGSTGGTGSTGGGNGKTTQPAAGQPAAQQPVAGQPAAQQPAPGQPAPQQPAPQQPAPQQPAPQQPAPQQPAPQQPAPQQPPATQPPVQPPAAAKATYSAIGGGNCSTASVAYAQHGYWEQGSTGWLSSSTGGYTGSGCNGKYVSMPMSGSDSKDDNDNSVVWTFSTAPVTSGSCTISVYVPNNSDYKLVGGKPAYYTVQNTPSSGVIGDFSVNQTSSRGNWVTSKAFTVSGGKISVMLHSRGLDWAGTATDKAHIAASAVRADCTAS